MMEGKQKKQNFNVAGVGHIDHGKTTFAAAVSCSKYNLNTTKKNYKDIDKAPEEKARGITINQTTLEIETPTRFYAHTDCPGHADYVKNMIAGSARCDAAVIIISLQDGVMEQTKQHARLIRNTKVKNIIVCLNKADLIPQEELDMTIELVSYDVLSLLDNVKKATSVLGLDMPLQESKNKNKTISGEIDSCQFFLCSALSALNGEKNEIELTESYGSETKTEKIDVGEGSVKRFLEMLDNLPEPERDVDLPFFMDIDGKYSITGRGTVITGKVLSGKVKPGEKMEIVFCTVEKKSIMVSVTSVEKFNKSAPEAVAGENVGLLCKGEGLDFAKRGYKMMKPGYVQPATAALVDFYVATPQDGGRSAGFTSSFKPHFFMESSDCSCKMDAPEGSKMFLPGDYFTGLQINFALHMVAREGDSFTLKEGSQIVGWGKITKVLYGVGGIEKYNNLDRKKRKDSTEG